MYRLKIRVEVKVKKLPYLWFIYVYSTGCYENIFFILFLKNEQNSICMTIECVWEQYYDTVYTLKEHMNTNLKNTS